VAIATSDRLTAPDRHCPFDCVSARVDDAPRTAPIAAADASFIHAVRSRAGGDHAECHGPESPSSSQLPCSAPSARRSSRSLNRRGGPIRFGVGPLQPTPTETFLVSVGLFWWEFNVRASTVLGVVGAGGIGQELKNSMDLLDFPRLLTIIGLILIMVTVIDHGSQWLRHRLT
jgi:hypothetical protein